MQIRRQASWQPSHKSTSKSWGRCVCPSKWSDKRLNNGSTQLVASSTLISKRKSYWSSPQESSWDFVVSNTGRIAFSALGPTRKQKRSCQSSSRTRSWKTTLTLETTVSTAVTTTTRRLSTGSSALPACGAALAKSSMTLAKAGTANVKSIGMIVTRVAQVSSFCSPRYWNEFLLT